MTIAIPLHRSAAFVDVVLANIAAIDLADAEIVVSDRTGLDDAAQRIAAATAGDPRVRVVERADGLDWVAHHATLLEHAQADLAMLMPHDDDFPPGHVRALVEVMEARPDVLVAFGALRIDGGPRLPAPSTTLDGRRWRAADAAHLFAHGPIGQAYRGVFRVSALRPLGIRHQARPEGAWSDDLFVLEVALAGRVARVPSVESLKRVHVASTHTTWDTSPRCTLGLHLAAARIVIHRGRDRTLPVALVLVARRAWGYLVQWARARR